MCCLFHEGNTVPCINAQSATLGKEIMMTTQTLNPATMRPDAVARVEAFDHNSKEALKAYRAAIDALGRVNEEAKPLSGIALARHIENNRRLRDELVEFITLYDQVAPYFEQARVAVQQDDDAVAAPDMGSHDPAATLFEERVVEPGQRTGIMDWLRGFRWPRNKQYSKGQLPVSDAGTDGTH